MTQRDESNSDRHGTMSGYNHDGCRCGDCRAAKARWYRETGANVRVGKRGEQKRASDRRRAARNKGAIG